MAPITASLPCPNWCSRASESHGYREDGPDFWPLERDHVVTFEAHGVAVEIVQLERARASAGPIELGPITALIFADETLGDLALDSDELRDVARTLTNAADTLDTLWECDRSPNHNPAHERHQRPI